MKNKLIAFINWFENNFAEENWLDTETEEWKSYTELPEYLEARAVLGMDEPNEPIKTKFVKEIIVIDPDTGNDVGVAIYKLETGGMIGIDSSYLEQDVGVVYSPFDENIELEIE
jgi:hypothetical protein